MALDGIKAALDRMLSTPERPPCVLCNGTGEMREFNDDKNDMRPTRWTECGHCGGSGDEPRDANPADGMGDEDRA